MALKDILVHVDGGKTHRERIETAVELARVHDAHLTGLYVIPEYFIPSYAEIHIPIEVIEAQEKEAQAAANRAEAEFRSLAENAGCPVEWLCTRGYADQHLIERSRYTDLVLIGQAEDGGLLSAESELEDAVLLGAARPVLVIPYIGLQAPVGRRIMVAWKPSREAVRAVHDAMPLLQRADRVEVVTVNPGAGEGDIPTADICVHLARHGVKAEAAQVVARDIEVGDALLSRASDESIDLIVLGAYGHTRWRETVFGGVTRHLLQHMTVPVMMSH
ncbi:MAG: universal stress protein [Candidatus Competibacterales bacterium]|nr:universal stress protein [Candidatus Competibacterales bacterium]